MEHHYVAVERLVCIRVFDYPGYGVRCVRLLTPGHCSAFARMMANRENATAAIRMLDYLMFGSEGINRER